jgi:BolA protein
MKEALQRKLTAAFHPLHLEVIDQSVAHHGHKEAGSGHNSHFKIILVSKAFEEKSPLERHRMVYACLEEEIKQIHAVQLELRSE